MERTASTCQGFFSSFKPVNISSPRFSLSHLPKCQAQDSPGSGDSPRLFGNPGLGKRISLHCALLLCLLMDISWPPRENAVYTARSQPAHPSCRDILPTHPEFLPPAQPWAPEAILQVRKSGQTTHLSFWSTLRAYSGF